MTLKDDFHNCHRAKVSPRCQGIYCDSDVYVHTYTHISAITLLYSLPKVRVVLKLKVVKDGLLQSLCIQTFGGGV
jgi:hypothetical protein